MNKEETRNSINNFLRLYFRSCKEVYKEINFEKITSTQFKYLKVINNNEKVTLTFLANEFNTSKPTVNELLNKLEKSGIINKERSESDKRISYIKLTDIGKTLATTNYLESKQFLHNLEQKLTQREMKKLTKIFNKIGEGSR